LLRRLYLRHKRDNEYRVLCAAKTSSCRGIGGMAPCRLAHIIAGVWRMVARRLEYLSLGIGARIAGGGIFMAA